MKYFFLPSFVLFFFCITELFAESQEKKQFPNVSGTVLFQFQADRIISSKKSNVPSNNAYAYIEPNLALSFNKNWSLKTQWRVQPNNVLTTRDGVNRERYRTIFQDSRGINSHDTSLLVEELKINFENDDMKAFAGKFDPTFGTGYNKAKRIGVFTAQFNEDYNLREKIGGGITAFFEKSSLSVNTFFNDTTGLSSSAINNRGRADQNDGAAGNTGTLSSYSAALEGEDFFDVENLFYNFGYRNLAINGSQAGRARETGYTTSFEYLYKTGQKSSITPFIELVKIDNFTGEKNRNATYSTAALLGKFSNWTASVSHLSRKISQPQRQNKISDNQLQLSAGYKFTNNITFDVTHSSIKENSNKGNLIGANLSYLYKF
jgi:hypothetical protein